MSRLLVSVVLLLARLGVAKDGEGPVERLHVQIVPAIVYKVDDPGHAETESWTFNLVMLCPRDCALKPLAVALNLYSGGTVVDKQAIGATELKKETLMSYRILRDTPLTSPRRRFLLNEAFDLRLTFTRPKRLSVDRVRVRLAVNTSSGEKENAVADVPVAVYHQKTELRFPFRGPALVVQGWINDGGHSAYANQFAIDVLGLDANYAPQTNDNDENTSYAGWDREILAPAAGTVIYARNDVPNNPNANGPDERLYGSQHDPVLAVAGNCVVIDHGNSEFSVMMHMRQGSVVVKVGDRVKQGDVVGHLGNSGDSFGPHLHYQLQAGPELFREQSLPFSFQNVNRPHLFRGTYFRAK
jgi:hypothetical protein